MNPAYRRAVLGIVLATGMLGALPTAVLAVQPSCGDILTANTTLTANLDCSGYGGNALGMGANGITLNLNGKTLTGPAGADGLHGVDTNGYHRTKITNGKIVDFFIGVYLGVSNRTTVSFLAIDGEAPSTDYGVYEYQGVLNVFNHLEVWDALYGVYQEGSASSTLMNSDLTATDIAVYNYQTTKNRITANTLHGDGIGAYEYQSHRNAYSGNTANSGGYGFHMECDGWGQVTLTGNTANNNDSTGFILTDCYVVDHPVEGFIGSRITGNTANGNDRGFEDYDSYNELWRNNTANDNDSDGFYFDYPSNHRIVYNTALRNGDDGFEIEDNKSYYNVDAISFNTARRNDSYGFYAEFGSPGRDNVARFNSPNCFNVDC